MFYCFVHTFITAIKKHFFLLFLLRRTVERAHLVWSILSNSVSAFSYSAFLETQSLAFAILDTVSEPEMDAIPTQLLLILICLMSTLV